MTEIEKQIAIAEACGIRLKKADYETGFPYSLIGPSGEDLVGVWTTEAGAWSHFRHYDTLDSIREAVLMQDEEFQREFAINLFKRTYCQGLGYPQSIDVWIPYIHQLTVGDWGDAFVEVLEKRKAKS